MSITILRCDPKKCDPEKLQIGGKCYGKYPEYERACAAWLCYALQDCIDALSGAEKKNTESIKSILKTLNQRIKTVKDYSKKNSPDTVQWLNEIFNMYSKLLKTIDTKNGEWPKAQDVGTIISQGQILAKKAPCKGPNDTKSFVKMQFDQKDNNIFGNSYPMQFKTKTCVQKEMNLLMDDLQVIRILCMENELTKMKDTESTSQTEQKKGIPKIDMTISSTSVKTKKREFDNDKTIEPRSPEMLNEMIREIENSKDAPLPKDKIEKAEENQRNLIQKIQDIRNNIHVESVNNCYDLVDFISKLGRGIIDLIEINPEDKKKTVISTEPKMHSYVNTSWLQYLTNVFDGCEKMLICMDKKTKKTTNKKDRKKYFTNAYDQTCKSIDNLSQLDEDFCPGVKADNNKLKTEFKKLNKILKDERFREKAIIASVTKGPMEDSYPIIENED